MGLDESTAADAISADIAGESVSSIEFIGDYVQIVFDTKRLSIFPAFALRTSKGGAVSKDELTLGVIEREVIGRIAKRFAYGEDRCLIELEGTSIFIETGKSIDRETVRYVNTRDRSKAFVV